MTVDQELGPGQELEQLVEENARLKADNRKAIKVILNAVPYKRLDDSLDFALDENIIVSGSRELEMMEVERVRSGKFTD